MRRLLRSAALGAGALAVHAAVNPLRPAAQAVPLQERISVLLPLRDEADRVEPCLRALLVALDACNEQAELVVLDDGSADGTSELVRRVCGDRARVHAGRPLPSGWLGKPHACQQLFEHADASSTVLVYLDADVVLAPDALLRTVATMRSAGLQLVSPYPRQTCGSVAERLVQPLLQWSWLTFLPLDLAERSSWPSLGAANGQLLCLDTETYRRAGGHAAVRSEVLDDVALLRAVKAVGGRGGVTDGTALASCRMYDGWPALREGYSKSLWAAFGSPLGAVTVTAFQLLLYVAPALASLHPRTRRVGLAGYAAGVAGRVVAARRTGGRGWPDALAHPVSVAIFAGLTARSWSGHRSGRLTWKGRQLA